MRHKLRGRHLSRDTEHRKAMRRNLVQSLFEHGKVRTTLPKAKEVRAMAEKLITLFRLNTLNSRRRLKWCEVGSLETLVQALLTIRAVNIRYPRIIRKET